MYASLCANPAQQYIDRRVCCVRVDCQAIGIEMDLASIASAITNAANNGLVMDNYYPEEVSLEKPYRLSTEVSEVSK